MLKATQWHWVSLILTRSTLCSVTALMGPGSTMDGGVLVRSMTDGHWVATGVLPRGR